MTADGAERDESIEHGGVFGDEQAAKLGSRVVLGAVAGRGPSSRGLHHIRIQFGSGSRSRLPFVKSYGFTMTCHFQKKILLELGPPTTTDPASARTSPATQRDTGTRVLIRRGSACNSGAHECALAMHALLLLADHDGQRRGRRCCCCCRRCRRRRQTRRAGCRRTTRWLKQTWGKGTWVE